MTWNSYCDNLLFMLGLMIVAMGMWGLFIHFLWVAPVVWFVKTTMLWGNKTVL